MKQFSIFVYVLFVCNFESVNAREIAINQSVKTQIVGALETYKGIHHDHTIREHNCRPGEPGESTQVRSELRNYKLSRKGKSNELYLVSIKMNLGCYIYSRLMACPGNTLINQETNPTSPPERDGYVELVVYQDEIIHMGNIELEPIDGSGSLEKCGVSMENLDVTLGLR